ncbi:MAG: hypothetical protein IKN63_05170, partial [Bacilli bacterium]|nr:hypothetical protein [Bacilli bacterium]
LRTSKRLRKNYWYPEPSEVIKISFDEDGDTCTSAVEKGDLPGRYIIKVTCTKATNLNEFSIMIESTTLDEKVKLAVNSSSAYYLEVIDLDKFTSSSDKYTWKENPTNDDTITFSFKLKDKYQNYITYNLIGTNQFSIGSETYGSGIYYNIEFNSNSYLFTDTIPEAITKHTWNIIIVESNRKYSFIYTKIPGKPDLSKSYWTIDKTSYILKETSIVSVYLIDRLGVNLGTLEGSLNKEKNNIKVIANRVIDYSYTLNSFGSDYIIYQYTFEEIGDYKVKVTYNGQIIGEEKTINIAYQKVDLKSGKLYYNIGNDDILMLTTTQTNINNLESYPFYKFYLYTSEGQKITLYDKSLEAKCVMTYGDEKWEMIVVKLDEYLDIKYESGFEEKFSKLPLGKYYIELTFDNELLRYPLYLLGEQDVSSSSDYDLSKTYVKPTEIEAIAGEEKEVEIEFRAADGLRWNYEISTISFGISNSYDLDSDQLQIKVIKGDKNGRLKLKIIQTKSTTGGPDNILTMSYYQKTISQTISLKIRSA